MAYSKDHKGGLIVLAFWLLSMRGTLAQPSASVELPSFEVASVKPLAPETVLPPGWQDAPIGRQGQWYRRPDITLRVSLQIAYGLPPYRVEGPSWMASRKYDIVAKMPLDTPDDQVLLMFQRLLIERFHLKLHWEERSLSAYALIVDKNGPKLKRTEEGSSQSVRISAFSMTARHKSMEDLASILMRWADHPVVDMTALNGCYDFELDWRPAPGAGGGDGPAAPNARDPMDALRSLSGIGLKVVPRKLSIRFLVIDDAQPDPAN